MLEIEILDLPSPHIIYFKTLKILGNTIDLELSIQLEIITLSILNDPFIFLRNLDKTDLPNIMIDVASMQLEVCSFCYSLSTCLVNISSQNKLPQFCSMASIPLKHSFYSITQNICIHDKTMLKQRGTKCHSFELNLSLIELNHE